MERNDAEMQPGEFLTPREVVDRWAGAVSIGTLANWRAQGKGPTHTKVGSRVIYRIDDVEAYERQQRGEAAE